jgi:hypothetical protein
VCCLCIPDLRDIERRTRCPEESYGGLADNYRFDLVLREYFK